MKTIWFDMDGTIADLYSVKDWLYYLQNEETYPYEIARPLYNKEYLDILITKLKADGYTIGIISYVAHNSTKEYAKRIENAKIEWLNKYFPYATEIHIVQSTIAKSTFCNDDYLVDDEKKNLIDWENAGGRSIDANKNIIWQLWNLVAQKLKG